jgi:hypothetical protein
MSETFVLLITTFLPIAAIFLAIYLAVRLAIRHEHRSHPDRRE